MLKPVIAIAVILRMIDAFGTFDQVFVMTRGGPGEATRLLSILGYETTFKYQAVGYGSAMFVMIGVICLIFAITAVRLLKRTAMKIGFLRGLGASLLFVVTTPIYWLLAASLKANKEITQDATLFPHAPTFDNYIRLFSQKEFGAYLLNSIVVTSVSVTIALVCGTLGGLLHRAFRAAARTREEARPGAAVLRIVPRSSSWCRSIC